MDLENILNSLKKTVFGESKSMARRVSVLTSAAALLYYLAAPSSDQAQQTPEELDIVEAIATQRGISEEEVEQSLRAPASVNTNSDRRSIDRTGLKSTTKTRSFNERIEQVREDEDAFGSGNRYPSNSGSGSSSDGYASSNNATDSGSNYGDSNYSDGYTNPNYDSSLADSLGSDGPSATSSGDGGGSSSGPVIVGGGGGSGTSSTDDNGEEDDDREPDTSDYTEIGDGDDSSSDSGSPLTCSFDKSQGTYGTPISVTLTCSEAAQITYCLQTGGGVCDPRSSPSIYSAPVNITLDGTYSLSFYGEANSSGNVTSIQDLSYIINTTLPDLSVLFPKINVQTTELPFLNQTQSNDFGKTDHYYYQINFKSHDPTPSGLNWTCEDMKNAYTGLTSPAPQVIQNSFDISPLDPITDQIEQSVDMPKLDPGDNWVVTIIEDQDRGLVSCQAQKVIVKDFHITSFTGTGATPVTAGVRTTAGSFISYGHFQATPSSSTSGNLENEQGTNVQQSGFFSITY